MSILDYFRRRNDEEREKARKLKEKIFSGISSFAEKVRPKIEILKNTKQQVSDFLTGEDDEYRGLESYYKAQTKTIYERKNELLSLWKKKQIDENTLNSGYKKISQALNTLTNSDDKLKKYTERRKEIGENNAINAMPIAGLESKIAGTLGRYVKKIAGTVELDIIVKYLNKLKISKDIVNDISKKLVKTNDVQNIYRIVKGSKLISQIEKKTGYLGKDIRNNLSLAVDKITKSTQSYVTESKALKELYNKTVKNIFEKSKIPVIEQEKNLLKLLKNNLDDIHKSSVEKGDISDYGRAKDIINKLEEGKPVAPDETRFAYETLKRLDIEKVAVKEATREAGVQALKDSEKKATEKISKIAAKERATEDLRQQLPDLLEEAGIVAEKPLQKAGRVTKTSIKKEIAVEAKKKRELKSIKKEIIATVRKETKRPISEIKSKIGFQMKVKNLSKETVRRVSKSLGVKEWKNVTEEQAGKVLERLKTFKEGDHIPTEKQFTGLKSLYPDKDLAGKTVREIAEELGAGNDPLSSKIKNIISYVEPIVRTKRVRGEVFKKVIDNIQYEEQTSFIRKRVLAGLFDKYSKLAYKEQGIFSSKKKVWKNVFNYLDTGKGELKAGEKKLADFMKNYLKNAKEYLVKNGDMARGRTYYVTHRAAELSELIKDNGLLNGINKWTKNRKFLKGDTGLPADIWVNLDNIMGTTKSFKFSQKRTGALIPTKNIERIYKEYMSLFETKKFLDNALPQIHAAANVLTPRGGNTAKWLMLYGKQLKGRQYNMVNNAVDKVVSLNYFLKLGFRHVSAMKNLIGGEVNNFIQNGFLRQMLGKERLLTRPIKTLDIVQRYGFLAGDYVDVARAGLVSKAARGITKAGFIEQKLVEMEIRSSQVAGLLTKKEFKTGVLTKERILEIMDNLEVTQGVFTAARSPLAVKTPYGRAALQFSRWIITDTAMSTSIVKSAFKGTEKLKNQARLARMLTAYIGGGYLAYEYGKAGYDKAKQYAETLQEPIKATVRALDGELATQAVSDNPSIQIIQELNYSLKWLSYKLGAGDMPRPIEFKKGITQTYLAPKRQLEEFGIVESDTSYGQYKQLKNMKATEANRKLNEIKKTDKQRYTLIKKYIKWDKLKLSDKERDFARMGVKNGERSKAILKYILKQKNRNEAYKRLKEAEILTDEVKKQIISLQSK